jgi:hypothetical protein
VRGHKKKGTRGFIGLKDEVKDGFEKLSNSNIEREREREGERERGGERERERQKWLLDGFALFLWHD